MFQFDTYSYTYDSRGGDERAAQSYEVGQVVLQLMMFASYLKIFRLKQKSTTLSETCLKRTLNSESCRNQTLYKVPA